MKKAVRICGWSLVILILLAAIGITFTIGWRPFIGPKARPLTSRKFESTPERLARGKYLVDNALGCFDCHAEHDWTAHDNPVVPGTLGGGQYLPITGLPGQVYAPNISPDLATGAGGWSDDAFARAIREGVGHDGRALFPLMPYLDYRNLSDEDLASIVVYIRSIPPVRKVQPPTQLIFPVKYLIRSVPQPLDAPVPQPDLSTPLKRGQYLVTIVGCTDCHTPQDAHGQPIPGLEFAGGQVFDGPWGRVASANITSDPSGIPYYDLALFTQVFRTGYARARKINQLMPWSEYRGLTDEDIAAIFTYVKTFKPVKHYVDNTMPPTFCRICKQTHGGGDRN
jgi:hypothetical protein